MGQGRAECICYNFLNTPKIILVDVFSSYLKNVEIGIGIQEQYQSFFQA